MFLIIIELYFTYPRPVRRLIQRCRWNYVLEFLFILIHIFQLFPFECPLCVFVSLQCNKRYTDSHCKTRSMNKLWIMHTWVGTNTPERFYGDDLRPQNPITGGGGPASGANAIDEYQACAPPPQKKIEAFAECRTPVEFRTLTFLSLTKLLEKYFAARSKRFHAYGFIRSCYIPLL